MPQSHCIKDESVDKAGAPVTQSLPRVPPLHSAALELSLQHRSPLGNKPVQVLLCATNSFYLAGGGKRRQSVDLSYFHRWWDVLIEELAYLHFVIIDLDYYLTFT